jgi:hypothetical protein
MSPPPTQPARPADQAAAPSDAPMHAQPDATRTAAWVTGGAGALALLIGTVAGVTAAVDKGAAHCDSMNGCDGSALAGARSAAAVADVSFMASGVLFGTAVTLVLLPPHHDSHAALTLTPVVSNVHAGLSLGGSF